jgi:hypothetical protein
VSDIARAAAGKPFPGPPSFVPSVYTIPGQQPGMVSPGNLDLAHRPVAHNPDGSISTVRSITVGIGNKQVLLPTVIGGKVVSDQQAIKNYRRTSQNLGTFANDPAAERYAQLLHILQAAAYAPYAGGQ